MNASSGEDEDMDTLREALGIDQLLRSADRLAAGWGIEHPDLGLLGSVADFERASFTGDVAARDDVLIGLAQWASAAGEDCPEAAAVLCHLLVPGTLAKLRTSRPSHVSMAAFYGAAAQHLWIGARTFDWEHRRKVAASIQWQVRRATLADLGLQARDRGDRTWNGTQVVEDSLLDWHLLSNPVREVHVEPEAELDEVLAEAERERVLSSEDVVLLRTVVEVGQVVPAGRGGVHGLMSRAASAEVGARLGIAGTTARRRLARVLRKLQYAQAQGLIEQAA